MNKVGFYTVKIIAIFILSVVHLFVGGFLSILLDEAIPIENMEHHNLVILIIEVCCIFGIIGIVYYLFRITIKNMPFFLDGVYGFKYSLLQEVAGGIIIGYTLYAYQDKLVLLLKEIRTRVTDWYHGKKDKSEKK